MNEEIEPLRVEKYLITILYVAVVYMSMCLFVKTQAQKNEMRYMDGEIRTLELLFYRGAM